MSRALRTLLAIIATVPLSIGGSALAQSPQPSPEPVQVLDVEWELTRLDGDAVPADPAITATFASDGSLSGTGGCNHYSATWASNGTTLTVTDLLATFMHCGDEVDQRESRYFDLVQGAASWTLEGSAVVVTTGDGATLVFGGETTTPVTLPLVGPWSLRTVDGEAPPAGMAVTIEVGADGTLHGVACNAYDATYSASEAGDLSVGPIAATRKLCGDPQDAFEATYLDALQGATSWDVQGAALTLSGVADLVFGNGLVSDATLTGQEWMLTALNGAPIAASLGVTATFGENGALTGSGGCNRFTGPYTVDGESLSIGPLAATRKSCGTTVDDLERTYLDTLEQTFGYAISGQDMALSAAGDQTLTFSTTGAPVEPVATPAATPVATPPASLEPSTMPGPSASTAAGSIVGRWQMTDYVGRSLPAGMLSIDITFADDGTFSGFGGCNDYSGAWSLDGTSLSLTGFEPAASGSCDQMTQSLETGYFSLIPFLDTAEVKADGTLDLSAALAGGQGFAFQRAG